MREWDFTMAGIYSELLERVRADADIPSAGSVVTKTIKGNKYDYQRLSFMGKPLQFYIGVSVPAEDVRERLGSRAQLCSMLAKAGANHPDRATASVIELLDAMGVFRRQKAVLVGSHAFSAIGNMLGVSWQAGLTHTMDVDIGRDIHVAGESIRVHDTLLKAGFMEIPSLNRKHPASSFALKRQRIKIDFLTPMTGKPATHPARLTGMGVYAERLRFLDYLIEAPEQAVVLTKYGVLVHVPQPARFAFHKLIVSTRRPAADELKRKKDIMQAAALIQVLSGSRPHDLADAWSALAWKEHAGKGMAMLDAKTKALLDELDIVSGD